MTGEDSVQYLLALRGALPVVLHPTATLSPRQTEIAEYAASGATAPEIARHLGLRPDTVRKHIKAVYAKLGIASRLELKTVLEGASPTQPE